MTLKDNVSDIPAEPGFKMAAALRVAARLGVIVLATATVTSFLGGLFYLFDVLGNFRPLIAFAALGFAVILLLVRQHRLAFVSAAICAIGLAGMVSPDTQPVSNAAAGPVKPLKVITFNAWWYNRQMDDVERFLKQADADIIVLQEFGRRTLALRNGLKDTHPWQFDCQDIEYCDLAIFSRIAWKKTGAIASNGAQPPLLWATFGNGRKAYTVAGTHFAHPTHRRQLGQVETLAKWVTKHPRPVILVGDFNATPWSHAMTRLRRKAGINILAGIRPSWPATFGFSLLPIDHILVSPEITNLGVRRGPYLGSDHLPIIARLGTNP